jgi:hypothetical protein
MQTKWHVFKEDQRAQQKDNNAAFRRNTLPADLRRNNAPTSQKVIQRLNNGKN